MGGSILHVCHNNNDEFYYIHCHYSVDSYTRTKANIKN